MEAEANAKVSSHGSAHAAEHELLLCCARTEADAETAARINKLASLKLDWEYLLRAAYRHALTALLYHQLNRHAPERVPPHYLSELKRRFQANAARNLFLTKELCRILRRFTSEGVPVVPYKGPALAVAAYGNLSLRHFIDLDILVPKREVLRAKELLLASGYRLEPPLTDAQQRVVLRTQHNLPFVSDQRLVVELHWEVAAKKFSDALDAEGMWERLQKVTLAGETVEALAPEDALPALCVHGSKHFW
ncbi:MAG TPA: nucleotidyltransferase family protein, partial [Pyrinomonadaceae bacterium]|nr:nucleotidyltransferase family protein [Pyrinomonadaceae bacterium]